jgi:hypothetical protein
MTTIAIINKSTVITDVDAAKLANALAVQVNQDFVPAYGIANIQVEFFGAGVKQFRPGSWRLYLVDEATLDGAGGYHDITPSDSPEGYVFCKTLIGLGYSYTVAASHELLEMLGDPNIQRAAYGPDTSDPSKTIFYAYEVADAVEDDSFGYAVKGVLVSDFVLPRWFDAAASGGKFSFRDNVHAPFALAKGGYIGLFDGTSWSQRTADQLTHHSATEAFRGNRWHRRVAKHEAVKAAAMMRDTHQETKAAELLFEAHVG